jgi:hypothetical protein
MATVLNKSLAALFLLAGLAGSATAQTSAKSSTQAPRTGTADAAAAAAPVKSGEPEGYGRWVPRVDKQTCPKGSETYIDEKDGGVKCWVKSSTD